MTSVSNIRLKSAPGIGISDFLTTAIPGPSAIPGASTNKLVSVVPDNPNGAIVSHIEFQYSEVDKRCGEVEYVDGKIERIHNEAGWTDGKGQYVAAIRDARGSLRATWTKREVPTSPGTVNVQLMHYDNLTAYYPYGLPWADKQGGSRDQYEGKELERFAGLLTYDFHARRYDPQLCLFQGPDPFATAYPSLHPYLYCAANPVSLIDPSGCIFMPINDRSKEAMGEYLTNVFQNYITYSYDENNVLTTSFDALSVENMTLREKLTKIYDVFKKAETDKTVRKVSVLDKDTMIDGQSMSELVGFTSRDKDIYICDNFVGYMNTNYCFEYKDNPLTHDNPRTTGYFNMDIHMTSTTTFFHEVMESLLPNSVKRGSVIDYDNLVRDVTNDQRRPYDKDHNYSFPLTIKYKNGIPRY